MAEYDWERKIDMDRLRAYRQDRIDAQMKKDGVDVLISMRADNVRYITSFRPLGVASFFYFRYGVVKASGQIPYLLVASGDYSRALNDMPWLNGRVKPLPMDVMLSLPTFSDVFEALNLPKGTRIGVDEMGFSLYNRLCEQHPDFTFTEGSATMAKAKVVKGPEEIALIEKACVIAEAGMRVGIDLLREGVSEIEIAAEIQAKMVRCGSEGGHTQPTQVNSGENAVQLTRFPTERRIRNGDFVLMDVGCTYNGYNSDYCRTILVGTPSAEHKKVYRAVYEAIWAAIRACRPGASSADVDVASRNVLRKHGYEKYWFFGVTGHGIGISLQEPPVIGEQSARGEVPWV